MAELERSRGGSHYHALRQWALSLSRTPLHPQWISFRAKRLAARRAEADATGIVLDIGCGTANLRGAVDAAGRYVGLDYPATGKGWYGARPDVFADAASLPWLENSFDRVLMLDVLEHLPSPGASLQEAWRVLAPGGRFHVSVPFMYPLHDEPRDFQRLTEHGLRRSLEVAGFVDIDLVPCSTSTETAALIANIAISKFVADAAAKFPPVLVAFMLLVPFFLFANIIGSGLAFFSRGDRIMPCSYLVTCAKSRESADSSR